MTYSGSDDDVLRAAARLLNNGDEGSDLADRLLVIASRLTPDPHRDPPSGGVDGAGYPVAIPHHVAYQQSPNNAYAVVDATGALAIRGIGYYEENLTIDAARLREIGLIYTREFAASIMTATVHADLHDAIDAARGDGWSTDQAAEALHREVDRAYLSAATSAWPSFVAHPDEPTRCYVCGRTDGMHGLDSRRCPPFDLAAARTDRKMQTDRDALLRRARSELARMYGSSLLVESIDASFPRTDTRVHIPHYGSSTRCGQSMDQSPPPLAAPIHESFGAITCLACLDVEVAAASTESDRHSARLANLITARDALRNARQVGE